MNGHGRSSGAVSFVNALVTGVGSAAGICLFAEVEVSLARGANLAVQVDVDDRSGLIRSTVRAALEAWSAERWGHVRVQVRSDIPIGKGLKSSSAVGTATSSAVARALGRTISTDDIASLAARAARSSGQSATGAFDDALASLEPGIHVTDNGANRRLRDDAVDPDWRVLLFVPLETHRPPSSYTAEFAGARSDGERAAQEARAGRWRSAMLRNTELVERLLGYDYATLRRQLAARGALASGVSGLGPTLAAVVPSANVASVRESFDARTGEVIETRFCQPGDLTPGSLS